MYRSLLRVLTNERIDRLDATYFSSKTPEYKHKYARRYWNKINALSTEENFKLRRIISINRTDIRKKIWILFKLIPDNIEHLNRSVFFSIFETGNIAPNLNSGNEINLINMIIQYNSDMPEKGNLWLFGSHKEHDADEYVMLKGANSFQKFLRIFNDCYSSALNLNVDLAKEMLGQLSDNKVPTIEKFIENIEGDFYKLDLVGIKDDLEQNKIIDCYSNILD